MPKLKRPAFLNRLNTKGNKRKLLALGVIVFIALIGFAAYSIVSDKLNKSNEKVYAQAAGHKVYKQDIEDLIGKNKDVTEHQAAQALADKYLTEALAKERGITVTDKELIAQSGKNVVNQKNTNKYAYQSSLNQLYLTKLVANNKGVYKGKMLVANFSHHIAAEPTLPEDKAKDPKLGNPAAIAKDKKYAQDFITNLYDQITSGKITFDQAIKMEQNDPQLGVKAYPSQAHSDTFDTSYMPRGVLSADSIRGKINGIKASETTKPFVVRVRTSLGDPSKTAESYFLVIRMDETSGSYTGMDFGQYLDQAKQRLQYQVNV